MDRDAVEQLKRLFVPRSVTSTRGWSPPVDVYRTPGGWAVKLDAAGVRVEDISWHVEGNRLVVQGVRRDVCVGRGWQVYQMEIAYARFRRVVELPCDVSQARVRVEQNQGMVMLILDCAREPEGR